MENSNTNQLVPGIPFGGGFYAGHIRIDKQIYALIVAPKSEGEFKEAWNGSCKMVEDACSYNDGRTNTLAMAAAGSELAKNVLRLQTGGCNDWYLPSQDELEICYRTLKPTTTENYLYTRSGINLSAVDPTRPYTSALPAQTIVEAFQEDGAEVFEPEWYWSSTQGAANASCAWVQHFINGNQSYDHKPTEYRARAVRRLLIIE